MIDLIPIQSAAVCLDCRQVGGNLSVCAGCGSQSILGLSTIIDRQVEKEVEKWEPGLTFVTRVIALLPKLEGDLQRLKWERDMRRPDF